MSLDVKITKRFDGFALRTEFTAGNTTAARVAFSQKIEGDFQREKNSRMGTKTGLCCL